MGKLLVSFRFGNGNRARRYNYHYNDLEFPTVAIVRLVEKRTDLTGVINTALSQAIGDDLLTATDSDIYCAYLEIEGLTEKYISLFDEKISEERFFGSLLKVYLNPSLSLNGRIPIKDEIVVVGYADDLDFKTVTFAGYPSERPEFDPNLESYVKTKSKTAKDAFAGGP